MAIFGSFEYGTGIVYGPSGFFGVGVEDVEIVHTNLVRVRFTDQVVVNDTFTNTDNYLLADETGVQIISLREVRVPTTELTREVLLVTDPMPAGLSFYLTIFNLTLRDGSPVLLTQVKKEVYLTKVSSMLNALPSHLDARPGQPLRVFLEALGLSDERIGGARNELL